MKLKNILIVTEDVERSKKFYKDLFGLEVVSDNDGNVILTEGLVLQDKNIWKSFLDREIIPENCTLKKRISKLLLRSWMLMKFR